VASSLESLDSFAYLNGEWKTAARPAAIAPGDVRVLTWNVWFGGHMFDERCAALLVDLERRTPDVIALQEVTRELLADLVAAPWVRRGYQLSDLELWQTYDVVLLSRIPIRRLSALSLPTRMGRRLLVAELASGLAVGTVHLESMKESIQPRATQLRLIQPYLRGLGDDAVLVGDMNFKPDDTVEQAALEPEFVDIWPLLRPDEPGYTADSQINRMRFSLKPALSRKRIDRVFLRSTRWRPTAIELVGTEPIDADGTFTSDHFGLEVMLSPSPTRM
jgi:tyrosyl-DNA phosphodiesterase 2